MNNGKGVIEVLRLIYSGKGLGVVLVEAMIVLFIVNSVVYCNAYNLR